MSQMTVSELGRRTQTAPDTIRYYGRIGLLPDVPRDSAGYRLFDDRNVERLPSSREPRASACSSNRVRDLLAVVTGACVRAGTPGRRSTTSWRSSTGSGRPSSGCERTS